MRTSTQSQRPRLRLQDERERRNWSRTEVAHLCAVSESTIARAETGARVPSWGLRKRLERLYDVPMTDLFAEVTDEVAV
jgi:transcriptional regulator with XRE-family HTH domain